MILWYSFALRTFSIDVQMFKDNCRMQRCGNVDIQMSVFEMYLTA